MPGGEPPQLPARRVVKRNPCSKICFWENPPGPVSEKWTIGCYLSFDEAVSFSVCLFNQKGVPSSPNMEPSPPLTCQRLLLADWPRKSSDAGLMLRVRRLGGDLVGNTCGCLKMCQNGSGCKHGWSPQRTSSTKHHEFALFQARSPFLGGCLERESRGKLKPMLRNVTNFLWRAQNSRLCLALFGNKKQGTGNSDDVVRALGISGQGRSTRRSFGKAGGKRRREGRVDCLGLGVPAILTRQSVG